MAIPNQFGDNDGKRPEDTKLSTTSAGTASYVMTRVNYARDQRDMQYKARWKEYTRLARGFYALEDKNTDSERSKLIAPALAQAVEMTVAEMEEAVFSRKAWFDITDDIADDNKADSIAYRDQLLEDFELDNVQDAISKCFLMGAIYGTGIAKINVAQRLEKQIVDGKPVSRPRVGVTLECVRPDEFVIDTSALKVDDAEFVAHEIVRPKHLIKAKQNAGTYNKVPLDSWAGVKGDPYGTNGTPANTRTQDGGVLITEYFGKVPAHLLPGATGSGLVEAVVTVANRVHLLRAIPSPYTMKDRPIIAYQHDSVPGEFWGRGVCEKGYNPQKALDAELRARIDTLALVTAPMMGADLTRLPRNPDMRVRPGKTVFTRGRPSEVYEPITFGNPAVLAHTFQQSGDLERMIQMGTGAMDSATPVGVNSRNETASGMSQMQSGFIKRSKRTMHNLERQFLDPLVRRSLWRYMQFDAQRYPVDIKFVVDGTMGIMAKEVEAAQLTNMLGFLQPGEPARDLIVQAILTNSSAAHKGVLKQAVDQMNAPPSPEQQQKAAQQEELAMKLQIAQLESVTAAAQKDTALANKATAEIELIRAKAHGERVDADLADDLVDIQAANAVTGAEKTRVAAREADNNRDRNFIDANKQSQT